MISINIFYKIIKVESLNFEVVFQITIDLRKYNYYEITTVVSCIDKNIDFDLALV